MINMSKQSVFGVVLFAIILVSGCAALDAPQEYDDKLKVVVSILPLADFVEKVGGDRVDVSVMIAPGASPATYEPTASQLRDVSDADVYVMVGSGIPFERVWMDKIREMNEDMVVVDCSSGVEIVDNDPHIWLSVRNAKVMVDNIYEGLVEDDGANEEHYTLNHAKYEIELDMVDREIEYALLGSNDRKFMVFHPAWGYFARDYELEQVAIEVEGKEPSSADVSKLVEFAKVNGIKVVFVQPQFSAKSAGVIAREIDGDVVAVDALARDYIGNMGIVSKSFANNM